MKNILLLLFWILLVNCTGNKKYKDAIDTNVIAEADGNSYQPTKKYMYAVLVISTPLILPVDSNDIEKGFYFDMEKYTSVSFIDSAEISDTEAESRLLDFEVGAWKDIISERTKLFQSKALLFLPEKASEECRMIFRKTYTFNTYKEAEDASENVKFNIDKYITEN